jgi:holo-[acyl-carrier protein] synthase
MRIIGHGIDMTPTQRIARMVAEHGDHFLTRVFSERELTYAMGRKRRDEHLAARFAAKEAVLKALGTGWSGGIGWTDVEVTLQPSGAPGVQLHGRALEIATAMGITGWHLSLTHTEETAMASAIAVGA